MAMHKRGLCRHAVSVCLSVRLYVTFVSCVKTNKDIFEIFSPSGSHTILVFHTKRDGDIPTGTPLTRASNAGGVGKKRDSLHTGLQCYQPYESRSVKNKAATDGGKRRAHRGVRCSQKTTTKCLWRAPVSLKPDRKTADKTAKINSDGRAV